MATKISGKQIDLTSFDTDDVSEGSTNLYYTDARTRAAVSAGGDLTYTSGTGVFSVTTYKSADFANDLAASDSDDIAEGTNNLYYTEARFTTSFGNKSTSDLSEGTNLYYTAVRGEAMFDSKLAAADTDDLSEGANLYYTDARVDARVPTTLAALTSQTIGAGSSTIAFGDDVTVAGDLSITGSLNITGDINSYNVTTLDVADQTIRLNAGVTGAPSLDGQIQVERGTSDDVFIKFDETNDKWQFSQFDGNNWQIVDMISIFNFNAGTGLSYDDDGEFSISNGGVGTTQLADGAVNADKLKQTAGQEAVVAQAIRDEAIIASKIKIESVGTVISSADVSAGYVDFADANDPTIFANSAFIVDQAHALTAVYLNGLKLNLDGSTGSALGTNVDATIGQNSNKLRLFLDTNLISNGDSIEVVLMFSN